LIVETPLPDGTVIVDTVVPDVPLSGIASGVSLAAKENGSALLGCKARLRGSANMAEVSLV
jgi:hypothetical protein